MSYTELNKEDNKNNILTIYVDEREYYDNEIKFKVIIETDKEAVKEMYLNNSSIEKLKSSGKFKVEEKTFEELVQHVTSINPVISANNEKTSKNIASILSLIAGTREYQFC